jgi:hypothetical protein
MDVLDVIRDPALRANKDLDPHLLQAVDEISTIFHETATDMARVGIFEHSDIESMIVDGVSTYVYQGWDTIALFKSRKNGTPLFKEFVEDLTDDYIEKGIDPDEAARLAEANADSLITVGEKSLQAADPKLKTGHRTATVRQIHLKNPNKFTKYQLQDPEVIMQTFATTYHGNYALNKALMG